MSSEQAIFKNLSSEIAKYEPEILSILVNNEKNCFENCRDDPHLFEVCMEKSTKKVKKQQKLLDLKLSFMKYQNEQCFGKKYNTPEICQNNAKENLNNYFIKFMENIK